MLFALVGQVIWQFFQTAISIGGMSLVNQQHLLTKIYFPRLFLPSGVVGGALVDLGISIGLLACFILGYHFTHYHFTPPVRVVLFPLLLVPLVIASLGMAYLVSAVTVTFRDVRFIVPLIIQLWAMVSFVSLPVSLVQNSRYARWEWVLALNPMYGIIEAFRSAMLGMALNPWHLVTATVVSAALCVFGMFYFRRTERRFADIA
jgi:lipopolysaccharide transport system permease protein